MGLCAYVCAPKCCCHAVERHDEGWREWPTARVREKEDKKDVLEK